MKQEASTHLYVHLPFCDGKCRYCAFYSEPVSRLPAGTVDRYLAALAAELDARSASCAARVSTVYIGGGTPTILTAHQIERLTRMLRDRLPVADGFEWTMEANPATVTPAKLRDLRDAGVTRLSLGAQSFDDDVLRLLGRRHTSSDNRTALRRFRKAGFTDVGIDLIASAPGQSPVAWRRTLELTLAEEPCHLSIYTLTLEPGTRLAAQVQAGRLSMPDDDRQIEALETARAMLERAGFQRYETSNYASPGHVCRHNLAFWRGADYLGIGAGAVSRIGRQRRENRAELAGYMRHTLREGVPPATVDTLSPVMDAAERLAFRFRLSEGVPDTVPAAAQPELRAAWERCLRALAARGVLHHPGDCWVTTAKGVYLADAVAREILSVSADADVETVPQ